MEICIEMINIIIQIDLVQNMLQLKVISPSASPTDLLISQISPHKPLYLTVLPDKPKDQITMRKRRSKYTLELFLEKAREIHGDKYDYSQITVDDVKGCKSKVPVICNRCSYSWNPTINDHINSKSGCPDCAGNLPWIRATGPNLGLALLVLETRKVSVTSARSA